MNRRGSGEWAASHGVAGGGGELPGVGQMGGELQGWQWEGRGVHGKPLGAPSGCFRFIVFQTSRIQLSSDHPESELSQFLLACTALLASWEKRSTESLPLSYLH